MILKALWLWQNVAHRSERSRRCSQGRVDWVEHLSTGEEAGEARRGGGWSV